MRMDKVKPRMTMVMRLFITYIAMAVVAEALMNPMNSNVYVDNIKGTQR